MAITFVASTTGVGGTSGGTTTAFNTTGATLIVVSISYSAGTLTVTDNKGNVYTALTLRTGASVRHNIYYTYGNVGTGHTITVAGGGVFPAIIAYAFAGTFKYDSQENGAFGTVSPIATGSVTPSVNGALVFSGLGSNQAGTDTVPASFTGGINIPYSSGINMQGTAAYFIQTTAAAINPSWTWVGAHTSLATSVAVFVDTAGTASGRVSQLPLETLILSDAPITGRLSQLPIEILINTSITPPTSTEKTQFYIIM